MKAVGSTDRLENGANKENYWRTIISEQEASGLRRVDYCRKHQISYDAFGYWFRKLKNSPKKLLIPVKLKTGNQHEEKPKILSTLIFKNGHSLQVHDKEALLLVLSKL